MPTNENLFSSVDRRELMAVQGGVVTIEYLVLGMYMCLALIVGVSATSTSRDAVASTSRTSTATR